MTSLPDGRHLQQMPMSWTGDDVRHRPGGLMTNITTD
jgi:hypothetical protein